MARYLLDTTALIDFSKGFEPVRSWILALIAGAEVLGVSPVGVAEFYAGLRPEERPEWDEFFGALPHWGISPHAARQAGIWRSEFRRRGIQLATTDVLTAAVALEQQAVVITRNVKDFPMPEVRVRSLPTQNL